jgi:hypothetical protein
MAGGGQFDTARDRLGAWSPDGRTLSRHAARSRRSPVAMFRDQGSTSLPSDSARALQTKRTAAPRESRIPVGKASLYSREIGRGQPIIVLHGARVASNPNKWNFNTGSFSGVTTTFAQSRSGPWEETPHRSLRLPLCKCIGHSGCAGLVPERFSSINRSGCICRTFPHVYGGRKVKRSYSKRGETVPSVGPIT